MCVGGKTNYTVVFSREKNLQGSEKPALRKVTFGKTEHCAGRARYLIK